MAELSTKWLLWTTITKSWFLSQRLLTVDIAPLSFIIGMYTEKHWKFIPFTLIPIYRSTTISILLRNKLKYDTNFIHARKADNIIDVMKKEAPWIAVENSKIFKKQHKQDFRNFLNNSDNIQKQHDYLFTYRGVYKAPEYLHNIENYFNDN